ncbi:hypothetical protein SASPL_129697 [Salvia splendens]|uniref:Uncharacterized protein n=1 Tax=Salvia splendens TaxID=180675 RepID=A0A8X8ZPN9_SALSN|nr:hypothetical protein SASPL_129697 [Salvia splendens]
MMVLGRAERRRTMMVLGRAERKKNDDSDGSSQNTRKDDGAGPSLPQEPPLVVPKTARKKAKVIPKNKGYSTNTFLGWYERDIEANKVHGVGGLQDQVEPAVGQAYEVQTATDEAQYHVDEPAEVVCEEVESEAGAYVGNAHTKDDVYRPIIDGLKDYGPFKSHSEGKFVPDFVEAAVVFE